MKVETTFSATDVRTILTGVAANKTGQQYNAAEHHADGSVTLTWNPAHEQPKPTWSWRFWRGRQSSTNPKGTP